MYVCVCKGVTDHQIRQHVSDGTQCGKCACYAKSITREAVQEARQEADMGLAYAV